MEFLFGQEGDDHEKNSDRIDWSASMRDRVFTSVAGTTANLRTM